jgi:CheY-like chemotaxis protein
MAKVLVVDDDAEIRDGVRQLLENRGHSVVEAADGEAGIRQLADPEIDVVLIDLLMPTKEGLETIREIRSAHPNKKIVAMSGYGSKDLYLPTAVRFGAEVFLTKPFTPGELLAAMARLLSEP